MPRKTTSHAATLRVQLGCLAIGTIAGGTDAEKQARAAYTVLSDFARDLMNEHPEIVKIAAASEHAKRAKSWDLICGIYGVDPNDPDGFKFEACTTADFVQFSPSKKARPATASTVTPMARTA